MILLETLLSSEDFLRKVESEYLYQIGKEEGVTEGKLEGKAEGKIEVQKQIVEKMKEFGLAAELITLITNIPVEEVRKI